MPARLRYVRYYTTHQGDMYPKKRPSGVSYGIIAGMGRGVELKLKLEYGELGYLFRIYNIVCERSGARRLLPRR